VAPPYLSNPSPNDGATLHADRHTAKRTPISFVVNNPDNLHWVVWLKFRNTDRPHLAYSSVVGFLPPFDSDSSTWISSTGRLTILQQDGWQDEIEFVGLNNTADVAVTAVRPGGAGSNAPPHAP